MNNKKYLMAIKNSPHFLQGEVFEVKEQVKGKFNDTTYYYLGFKCPTKNDKYFYSESYFTEFNVENYVDFLLEIDGIKK